MQFVKFFRYKPIYKPEEVNMKSQFEDFKRRINSHMELMQAIVNAQSGNSVSLWKKFPENKPKEGNHFFVARNGRTFMAYYNESGERFYVRDADGNFPDIVVDYFIEVPALPDE